jgi:hypothetical protein
MEYIKKCLLLLIWLLVFIPGILSLSLGFIIKILINAFIKGMFYADRED